MMTTLSSEGSSSTSTAPRIFHVSDHVLTSSSSDSPNTHRCPLCKNFKKYFYCKECVQGGYIAKHFESLNSIRTSLDDLTEKKRKVEENCLQYLESKQKADTLQVKIRQGKEKNRMICLALEEKRQTKKHLCQKLRKLERENQERFERLRYFKTKNEGIEDCILRKHEDLSTAQKELHSQYEQVTKLARLRVQQLFKYIFPISVVKPTIELESSGESIRAIKEKWVYADYCNEMQYKIVEPCLPGSGNYANYNIWAKCDGTSMTEDANSMDGNPAVNISTALAYTAQLVNVLSFLLNIRLPYKIIYSEFNSTALTEPQFSKKVAKLNGNILYLCISQNIEISALSPTRTIQNLLQLRDKETVQLGSHSPMEMNDLQAEQLERLIPSDLKSTDSDSDEMSDWEALPQGVQCPEAAPGPATVPPSVITSQQASSLAGGLVTSAVASVASIWRGFTGR